MKKGKLYELYDIIEEDVETNGFKSSKDIDTKYRWLLGNRYELVENVPYEKFLEIYIDCEREYYECGYC